MKVNHIKIHDLTIKGWSWQAPKTRVTLLCRRRLGYKPKMAPDLKIRCRVCRRRVIQ